MKRTRRITSHEIDQLFAGSTSAREPADLGAAIAELRSELLTPADEAVAARHVKAIAEAAREAVGEGLVGAESGAITDAWRRIVMRSKTLVLKVAAGATAGLMSTAGMAYAGVDLPGTAAEQAVEAVLGLELPNQADRTDAAADATTQDAADRAKAGSRNEGSGNEVSDFASGHEGERGCEFGQAVTEVAQSDKNQDAADSRTCQEPKGSRATGEAKSAEGRAKADEHSADAGSNGDEASAKGKATAGAGSANGQEKSAAASDKGKGSEKSGSAGGSGDDASAGGQSTAEAKSAEGKAKGDEGSAGAGEEGGRP